METTYTREMPALPTHCLEEAVARGVRERTAALQADYEHEHRLAQMLQRALLLTPPLGQFPGLTVESLTLPGGSEPFLSGDFCDAFSLSTGEIALVVGDVCGRGMSAAVRIPEIKFALRAFLSQCPSPDLALSHLNEWLCTSHERPSFLGAQFATVALVVLHPETGIGVCSLAGADPPLILRPFGSPDRVTASGMALGVETGWPYEASVFHLGMGDLLLMTTDGISEARRGDMFLGDTGIAEIAMQAWQTMESPGAAAMAQEVLAGAQRFSDGALCDDASLLVAERHRF